MNLLELRKAAATLETNHSILIYGPPKGGKTKLAGTAARIPEVTKIYYFGLENGHETLLNMGLTEEELTKITVFRITDTRDDPFGIETMLKVLTSKTLVNLCDMHGRVDCAECKKAGNGFTPFCYKDCKHTELIIIDSGSQLGDSALAAACLGKPGLFKPTFDEYGMVNKWLGDCLSVIQQCKHTNFVVITHEIALEDDEGKDKFFPLMGSKAFSMKCAKYFGTVTYVHKKLNKHAAGSGSTYRGDLLTGSRVNAFVENNKNGADMRTILIEGGVLRAGVVGHTGSVANTSLPIRDNNVSVITNVSAADEAKITGKPLTFTERMALQKAKT